MNAKIKRMYRLEDDYQEILFQPNIDNAQYTEHPKRHSVVDGGSCEAYIIEAETFYNIVLNHVPPTNSIFTLHPFLSKYGLIYNYDPENNELFLYNTTQNNIYIKENEIIGRFL